MKERKHNIEDIKPHKGRLGRAAAAHLLRRCSFQFTKRQVDLLSEMTADEAVDHLFRFDSWKSPYDRDRPYDHSLVKNNDLEQADWIVRENTDGEEDSTFRQYAIAIWWFRNALHDPTAMHKLAFFLHTIYVTGHVSASGPNDEFSRLQYDHYRLQRWLIRHKRGLKEVAKRMTTDNYMLCYLNNHDNYVVETDRLVFEGSNENYAREFLELFTIEPGSATGPGEYHNYTESDISAISRILTGIRACKTRNSAVVDPITHIPTSRLEPKRHDWSDKYLSTKFEFPRHLDHRKRRIKGRKGKDFLNELDDLIDVVFYQQSTALAYARKIYRYYISSELDKTAVRAIANRLYASDYNLVDTVKWLLKSEHFYINSIANVIKSPLELLLETMSFLSIDLPELIPSFGRSYKYHFNDFGVNYLIRLYGENTALPLFNPPDVAGYPPFYAPNTDQVWYNGVTLPFRHGIFDNFIQENVQKEGGVRTQVNCFKLLEIMSETGVNMYNAKDVVESLTSYLFPMQLTSERLNEFVDELQNRISMDSWDSMWRQYIRNTKSSSTKREIRMPIEALLKKLFSAQEFQLK